MNFVDDIVLENTRVRLEPLILDHLDELLPISINHPNLLQYSPSPFGTEKLLQEYLQNAVIARENKLRYPFAIFDKSQSKYAGSTSYGNISLKDKRLEIGWTWIDRASQGTGLNKYSKHLLLSYAFVHLGMERVEFKTDKRNVRSRKAIEKIGGVFEGILRSHTLLLDGHRRDTAYYSILQSEWSDVEDSFFVEMRDS